MSNIMDVSKGEKNAILTYDSTFLNCDSMFIEYDDVIKCPFFLFLNSIKENDALNELFDLTEISGLDNDGLYEWYINRKDQNIFKSLKLQEGVLETYFNNDINMFYDWCETVPYQTIDTTKFFVETDTELNFVEILKTLMTGTLVPKYYVYTPKESKMIREDLIHLFNNKVIYVHGNLEDVLRENKITENSTFVFSDITKITALENVGILNYASVIIADKYSYNYKDSENIVLDLTELAKRAYFKLDFFNNIDAI